MRFIDPRARTASAVLSLTFAAALSVASGSPLRAEEPPAPAPQAQPPVPSPAEAWADALKEYNDPAKRSPKLLSDRSRAFLESFEAAKREAAPEDGLALGNMYAQVGRAAESLASYRLAFTCERLDKPLRAQAAIAFTSQAAQAAAAKQLRGEALTSAVKEAEGLTPLADGPLRSSLLAALGSLHAESGQTDQALSDWLAAAEANPSAAAGMAGRVVGVLKKGVESLEQAAAARRKATPLLTALRALQVRAVAEAKAALGDAKDPTPQKRREQALAGAERGLAYMETVAVPLTLFGAIPDPWTVVKTYAGKATMAEYRGKVVVLDFWATWCHHCIRSFPALRDLVRDYEGKDLAIVGVTASGSSVWDHRYELDEDVKHKGDAAPPVLSRPRLQGTEATPEQKAAHEQALAEFRTKEMDVIAAFLKNHEVPWDVVQIDEEEPGKKFGLTGWPYCVVLDRQGRVRYMHSGALLRDDTKKTAEFRALLDGLLAEPAPK